jgi:hypothetical protein
VAETIHIRSLPGWTPAELGLDPNSMVSSYRGVLVEWDRDRDVRILWWLDALAPEVRARLILAGESKGVLSLVWSGPVPVELSRGRFVGVADPDDPTDPALGDSWTIGASRDVHGEGAHRPCATCRAMYPPHVFDQHGNCPYCLDGDRARAASLARTDPRFGRVTRTCPACDQAFSCAAGRTAPVCDDCLDGRAGAKPGATGTDDAIPF